MVIGGQFDVHRVGHILLEHCDGLCELTNINCLTSQILSFWLAIYRCPDPIAKLRKASLRDLIILNQPFH